MRAAQVTNRIGPVGVHVREIPAPAPAQDRVLVQVKAAGVTFPDLLLSHGRYQETPRVPFTLGGEFAGVVLDAPAGSGFHAGQRIVGSSANCAFAEIASVPVEHVLPLPDDIPFELGACLPANYLTMHFAFTARAGIRPGERVLVHGASGGIGTASIQLALALGAEQVIAVTGADLPIIDARLEVVAPDGFAASALARTGGEGVDIVVDPVGGDRLAPSLSCLGEGGRALVIGFAGGGIPVIGLDLLSQRNVALVGVGWGAHLQLRPDDLHSEWAALTTLMARDARIRPPLADVLPLEEAATALRRLECRGAHGRMVLRPDQLADAG